MNRFQCYILEIFLGEQCLPIRELGRGATVPLTVPHSKTPQITASAITQTL